MDVDDTWRSLARRLRNRLEDAISRVTLEEFREQETIYDQTAHWGRELIYLASNVEWNRRTREILSFGAADSLETLIRVDVDFSRITHEAFRYRQEPVWLPLLILAPPRAAATTHATASVAPTPLVRDATGADVPVVPQSEARRWIAAALAEIVLDMAPESVPEGAPLARPSIGRDQRLLFSAALYRVLREAGDGAEVTTRPAKPRPDLTSVTGRLEQARQKARPFLLGLRAVLHSDDIGPGMPNERAELLIRRAARVLHALSAPSTIVVVGVSPAPIATAYSVTLAPRPLERNRPLLLRTSRARVQIDLTLADPDADRVVEVQLPDGVSFSHGQDVEAEVQLHQPPRSLRHITELMLQIRARTAAEGTDPAKDLVLHCLADFASARVDVARDTFRFHRTSAAEALGAPLVEAVPEWLDRLRDELREVTADPADRAAWAAVSRTCTQQLEESTQVQELRQVQQIERSGLRPSIFRILEAGLSGPRTAYVRLPAVENRAVRASPGRARLRLEIGAGDSGQLHAARYTGVMSLIVLGAVLVYLKAFPGRVDSQVLASALTLFAAIQAGRIEHPDRSSLRGFLAAGASWAGVAPVLPTVLLGVALAFDQHTSTWTLTLAAIAAQAVLQVALQLSSLQFPLWVERYRRPRMRLGTDELQAPDHERVDVLRSSWWRSTTAGALLLGRPAHAYVVEHSHDEDISSLLPPLGTANGNRRGPTRLHTSDSEAPERRNRRRVDLSDTPANILAVLRAGTLSHSLTFIVFREYPEHWWQREKAVKIDLDVDRLIAHEAPVSIIDVFIGQEAGRFPAIDEHPMTRALKALRDQQRLVLDCQMPCLPPKGGSRHRGWGRIRIGLRSDEVAALSKLLDAIATAIGSLHEHDVDLLIDMSTQTPPRWFQGQQIDWSHQSDLTPAELDVVRHLGTGSQDGHWLEAAACGYTLAGAEFSILNDCRAERPGLQLVGLTSALLYGTSVVFLLCHDPATAAPETNGLEIGSRPPLTEMRSGQLILFKTLQSQQLQGAGAGGRLLQVNARSSDRPGTLSFLAERLREGLARMAKIDLEHAPHPHVWYVQTEVAYGRLATTRMLISLPEEFAAVGSRSDLDRVEREVQQLMSAGLADPSPLVGQGGRADVRVLVNLEIVRAAAQPLPVGDDRSIRMPGTAAGTGRRIDLDRPTARSSDDAPAQPTSDT